MEQFSLDRFDGALEAPAWALLAPLLADSHREAATALLLEKRNELSKLDQYIAALQQAPLVPPSVCDLSSAAIRLGTSDDLTSAQKDQLEASLRVFMPWKKGPFSIFGIDIDAEWRSDLKWDRLVDHIGSLEHKTVADIGCHNGYFMLRMAEQKPSLVVGIEPVLKHMLTFHLLNQYSDQKNLIFAPFGIEHMDWMPEAFDTMFCLGILYHHTDPVGLLRKLRAGLKRGGEIVIDCQGIPGEDPISLTPKSRYAQARGIWFLPTASCLEHWVARAGFQSISMVYSEPLSVSEQRSTAWAPVDSLAEFLDPDDHSRTKEGYPAPWRHYMIAKR